MGKLDEREEYLLDQLEDPDLSDEEIARIEKKLRIIRDHQTGKRKKKGS